MPDDRVADLLSLWQSRQAAGDRVAPEELCKDAPELLHDLQRRIEAIRMVEAIADTVPAAGDIAATLRDHADTDRVPSFAGFTVVRQIGEGGMGRVFEARDSRLNRAVAIKEMKPAFASDPEARALFLREARAAAAVRHDHIVPIYHVGEQDGSPFLVMPLLRGESLATRIDRGPLPPAELVRVGREIALGLAAAHEAGLVHRDIKPANVWLESPRGRVLILDFGLARISDAEGTITRPGSVLGTPAYLSPEQATGAPMDFRADLFSLGVTLYHAATGKLPFQGESLTKTLRAVAEHHPPPPREVNPEVPPSLSKLIMRLMEKNPADRPASAAVALDERAAEPEPVPPPPPAEPRPPRRVRIALALAAVVAAALGLWLALR